MVVAKTPDSSTNNPDTLAALSPGPEIMLSLWTSWLEIDRKTSGRPRRVQQAYTGCRPRPDVAE